MKEYNYASVIVKYAVVIIVCTISMVFVTWFMPVSFTPWTEEIPFVSIFADVFILLIFFVLVFAISFMRYSIMNLMTLKYFRTYRPILIDNIPFHSKKKVGLSESDSGNINLYNHKVNVEIEVPNHGRMNVSGRVFSFKDEIKSVSVVIDPNNINKYIIEEGNIEREYKDFIDKYYNH